MTLRRIVGGALAFHAGERGGAVWGSIHSRVVLSCGHEVVNICRPQTPHDRIVYAWDLATPRGEVECRECDAERAHSEDMQRTGELANFRAVVSQTLQIADDRYVLAPRDRLAQLELAIEHLRKGTQP